MTRATRSRANLTDSVNRKLNMYALAAGATGVGALALAQPAEARIVYTRTHQVTSPNQVLSIDLNHDGIKDFSIVTSYADGSGHFTVGLKVYQYYAGHSNRIAGKGNAAAFRAGTQIGPKRLFSYNNHQMAREQFNQGQRSHFSGPWANTGNGVKNHYLGLKFIIGSQVHYGWARLTVTLGNHATLGDVQGTLTGYAYETIPDKPILAGNIIAAATKGAEDDAEPTASLKTPTPEPTTLAMLALGAPGLAIWRHEESELGAPKTNKS
jgi:hypothetical protein